MPTYKPYQKKYDADYIRWVQMIAQDVISLNAPIAPQEAGEPEGEIGDFIVDPNPTPAELVALEDRKKTIIKYMNKYLSERENKVIRMRFGFDGEEPRTLAEIGNEFNLSRERIRHIESSAIRKLRIQFAKHKISRENI